MTVSDLIEMLKDCAPKATVYLPHYLEDDYEATTVTTDGERVILG